MTDDTSGADPGKAGEANGEAPAQDGVKDDAPSVDVPSQSPVESIGGEAPQPPAGALGETTSVTAIAPATAEKAVVEKATEVAESPGGATASGTTGATRALAPVKTVLLSQRAPRLRGWLALLLVIISVVAIIVSVLAVWSRTLVFDTDTYVKTVAPVAEDPEVRRAVSVFVADKTLEVTDLETRIRNALPSDAKVLAVPLTNQLRSFLVDETDKLLGTETAQKIWVDLNRFTHEQLMAALEDRNELVTIGQNDVTLNLLPLIAVALHKLEAQIPQLLGRDVTLPRIDPERAPDQIRSLLQDAFGKTLPADFGTITLLKGDQGAQAKDAVRLFKDLVTTIVILTVVLVVAALLVSPHKRRTALQLGLGVLLAFVLTRVIEARLLDAIITAIGNKGGLAVARTVVSSAIESLNGFFRWVVVAAVIVAIGAFLASRPTWLEAMGGAFAKLFGIASDLSAPDTGAGRWVAGHLDLLRTGGVVVAIIVLLFAFGSFSAVLAVLIALIVYELALLVYSVSVQPDDAAGDTKV